MHQVRTHLSVCAVVAMVCAANAADAQDARFEAGVQIASARSGQFDAGDAGFGGRFAWRPVPLVGLEAELNLYPRSFPGRQPFSRTRVEALFGATAGVTFGRLRPFARLRTGFVDVQQSAEPLACILIYPPPLTCVLASGRTLVALDLGGGLEVGLTPRTFLRVDLGDRLVRYPGPVFELNPRRLRQEPFFGHDVRFATGAGLRF